MRFSSILVAGVLSLCFSLNVLSQDTNSDEPMLYGNDQQPGKLLVRAINGLVKQGRTIDDASSSMINSEIAAQTRLHVNSASADALSINRDISQLFVTTMVKANELFETTKSTIETFPDNASNIITLAVTLYPEFAQQALNAAIITGEIEANDALIAAITAGADPTTVSSATAAGATSPAAPREVIGAGIGAGGTGGGGTTASSS